jgi:hypothetical protein
VRPTVYIETTIPSYYCDSRAEMMHDILRTRQWWDQERGDYECATSLIVFEELDAGDYPGRAECLKLIEPMPLLEVTTEVLELAKVYQAEGLMPRRPAGDAVHVAIASWYRMDYLLTWNCRHIANANKTRRLEAINLKMHLGLPMLVTPHQLQTWEEQP